MAVVVHGAGGELTKSCPVCRGDDFEAYGGFVLFSGWGGCVGWE